MLQERGTFAGAAGSFVKMRVSLPLPLGLSLALHVAAGVWAVAGRGASAPVHQGAVAQTEVGETFDVPDEEPSAPARGQPAAPMANGSGAAGAAAHGAVDPGPSGLPDPPRDAEPLPIELGGQPAPQRPPPGHRPHRVGVAAAASSSGGQAGGQAGGEEHAPPLVYGAAGERGAVDLATAFTRGFPQAASADAHWLQAPFGSAGEAIVSLDIAASGMLVGHSVGGSPSAALRAGIERTIALIGARTFTSTGAQTRLRVSARVSPDQVHDGLHGDVFAIGGSFAQSVGNAFFALAVGRRIDVRVHAMP
jgi:hypothetical protein